MSKEFGYKYEVPVIESVHFMGNEIIIHLLDGRKITLPISRFPDIKKLSPIQRRKHSLLAGTGLMFDNIDTVYHVTDFLGANDMADYSNTQKKRKKEHSLVAEPKVKYKKTAR